MTRRTVTVLLAAALTCAATAQPSRAVTRFASLDQTEIDGYVFRPAGEGRHPALVFLHGCGGLLNSRGQIREREVDWASRLNALGYVVFMVDSFTPRRIDQMCAPATFKLPVYLARPKDAYGALRFLQSQDFVRPDRIGVVGWSQGGGTILFSIRDDSLGRPSTLPFGDFRAAVAFYPGSCRNTAHRVPWTSSIPLLVLLGSDDVWSPAPPCEALIEGAVKRGSPIELKSYPGAYHDFDWPDLHVHLLPRYRTAAGVVPITGMDPAARADALDRVPAFLAKYLRD